MDKVILLDPVDLLKRADLLNFFDDVGIVRGYYLSAIFPVGLVTVVFFGIV